MLTAASAAVCETGKRLQQDGPLSLDPQQAAFSALLKTS